MAVSFFKYQGSGNDFVIIDDREETFFSSLKSPVEQIKKLCDRHFGIGADGLILIRKSPSHQFNMKYFNADGNEGSMCGNGGRCAVAFARMYGICGSEVIFEAADGPHRARVIATDGKQAVVSLQLNDVDQPNAVSEYLVANTGSPHLIVFTDNVADTDVFTLGRQLRYLEEFETAGVNVNFVEVKNDDTLLVRTYERGVENETLSCGTGVSAAAIAAWTNQVRNIGNMYNIVSPGGSLKVSFTPPGKKGDRFKDVWLTGPAVQVFKGETEL